MTALHLDQLVNYLRSKNRSCMTADYFESFTHDECDGYPVDNGWMDEDFVKRHLFGLELNAKAEQAWRELKANVTSAIQTA